MAGKWYNLGMRLWIFSLTFIFAFVNQSHAQDERFFRRLMSGELAREVEKTPPEPKYVFSGATYRVDLNGDGKEEGIQVVKRDLMDWLDILTEDGNPVFKARLLPAGIDARIDRLRLVDLSPKVRVLIVQYYEGKTEARQLEATARLWFLTFENKDIYNIKLAQGPAYWHEFEKIREQYGRRLYSLSVRDIDGNGIKDIMVAFNHMMQIYRYAGDGKWSSL